ncbi:hypothetical protein MAR_033127 [Mya arenaria]|uniref:Uncharacterized protein n=1 Tax=Mya arenaria TaxID=6604 RepID=A0ABY7G8Y9_MYAAR|nr:hypothetical protein MAR_033127 [Mya arenaria]
MGVQNNNSLKMGLLYCIALGLVCACAYVEAIPTTTTEPSIIIGNPSDLFNTAVFKCADVIYGTMLMQKMFPPADSSLPELKTLNASHAKAIFDANIELLCKDVDKYSRCVKHFSKVGCTPEEEYIRRYIDIDQFGPALGLYCTNKELVKSNFLCTLEKVRKGDVPCEFGGIHGCIKGLLLYATQSVTKEVYCNVREASLNCRKTQLASCDVTYAEVMNSVAAKFPAKYCSS